MLDEIDRFVNWIRRRNPEAHTFRDYRCDLEQFVTCVGDRPPAAIAFADIDGFVGRLHLVLEAARQDQTFHVDRGPASVASHRTLGEDDAARINQRIAAFPA